MSTTKATPMTREEVTLLIDLVSEHKIVTSKATNAVNNQLKEDAWLQITDSFNASISSGARTMGQLRLKWDNLKKAARKRSALIKLSHDKTGGGKPDYIPPDEVLDRVASILGATWTYDPSSHLEEEETQDNKLIFTVPFGACEDPLLEEQEETQKKKFSFTPSSNQNVLKRRRKLEEEDIKARILRNEAITEYYHAKKKKMELEAENLELSNKKLRLELKKISST